MTILYYQDKGCTIEVKARSVITVCLEENPTTGYRWNVETAGGLELIGDNFEKGVDAIGSAGIRVFQFRIPEAGSYELIIRNWRNWEGERSIINRFYATIEVNSL